MASLVSMILLLGLPCLALIVGGGTMLMRNRRDEESHWVWVVGVILVVLGASAGLLVLVGGTLLMPV